MRLDRLEPRYTVLRELGSGGMGRVYLARDRHLGVELALKVLHERPADESDIEQAAREFALLSKLEHPGVARAYDFGFADGVPYFTSEFIAGRTLGASVDAGGWRRDPGELLELAVLLARALAFLHRGGILHLDVKPSNVLVAGDGRPVLVDFGLCRTARPGEGADPFGGGEGRLRGSLPYMAPEFFRGGPIGAWTDVYALGVTLYRTATGRLPRPGASAAPGPPAANGSDRWLAAPLPPSRVVPSLPRELDHVLLKAIALEPESRFPSAGELLELFGAAGCARRVVTPGRVESAEATTVGRQAELAAFDDFLDDFVTGRAGAPPVLLMTGPAGMGQTHLLAEMKVRAQTRGLAFYLDPVSPARRPAPGALLRALGVHLEGEARTRWDGFLDRLARPRAPASGETTQEERRLRWRGEVAVAAAALRGPVVVAADDLQDFDEVSVLLLLDLVRVLAQTPPRRRPGIALVIGGREEGPLGHLVGELADLLLRVCPAHVIALGPLDPAACRALFQAAAPEVRDPPGGLALFQETGGAPGAIVARALATLPRVSDATAAAEPRDTGSPTAAPGAVALPARGTPEREVLAALALLERPAAADELARLCELSPRAANDVLERLVELGLAGEERPGSALAGWTPTSRGRRASLTLSRRERRRAHCRLADGLRAQGDPRALLESVRHDEAAGRRSAFVEHGLRAVRYLMTTFQNRTAIDLLERVLAALPPARRALRPRITLTQAELLARVGEIDRGVDLLRKEMRESVEAPAGVRLLLRLRLATLHSRNGDFRLADSLFREGLDEVRAGKVRLARKERLVFLNEHAALKVFLGDHVGALALCEEGLSWVARGAPSRVAEEISLNLRATIANVALREFRFGDAEREFRIALEKAEAIGSAVNQAVILNNLGIAFAACDRYGDAVRAFRDAEKACLALDEGPSLSFVYGNLAVLHARMADFEAAAAALAKADAIAAGDVHECGGAGKRQRLFLEHHRGLALLSRGRYREARSHLEEAARIGRDVGDRLLAGFDEVFAAECLVFEAEYEAARATLLRLTAEEGAPAPPRRVALARLAFVEAMLGNVGDVGGLLDRRGEVEPENTVAFLEAGDDVFRAWALAIAGDHEQAARIARAAEDFFVRHGLLAGASLALWVRAEAMHLGNRPQAALELAGRRPEKENDLAAALWPLLEARCLIDAGPGDAARCADRLAEAGAGLLRCPLPEWSARLEAVRGALTGDAPAGAEGHREEIASRLPRAMRARYLESGYWGAWGRGGRTREERPRDRTSAGGARDAAATRTIVLPAGERSSLRRGLVTRSAAMRTLVGLLDRLRASELPVLIAGETGSGKELVARIIHVESPRAEAPLSIVDCAAVPEQLFDLELFGAVKGAFTGLDEDRRGLLARAGGGTVLFDEIGAASREAQGKLLRLLASGEYRPLGSEEPRRADVRFLLTTSSDLDEAVREGRFREDLLHRIRVLVVEVPPLRERIEDIPLLVELFLEEGEGRPPSFGPSFVERLATMAWPGNARELRNLVERVRVEGTAAITPLAAARSDDAAGAFPGELLGTGTLDDLRKRLERAYIVHHYRRLGGDTRALSELLGVRREQLYRRCAALGIKLRDLRGA